MTERSQGMQNIKGLDRTSAVLCSAVAVLLSCLCAGQEPGETVPFPVLDRYEAENRELTEHDSKRRRQAELEHVRHLVLKARQQQNPEQRLIVLLQAYTSLKKMLRDKQEDYLTRLSEEVWRQILQTPPPKSYTNSLGMTLHLVEKNGERFYVSEPLGGDLFFKFIEGGADVDASPELRQLKTRLSELSEEERAQALTYVSWEVVSNVAVWSSAALKATYVLPEFEQLQKTFHPVKIPVWTRTEWMGPSHKQYQHRMRCGVKMMVVWDGQAVIGQEAILPEVPFARLPAAGGVLVTDWRTGVRDRLTRLGREVGLTK